jgi:hypothetical protein
MVHTSKADFCALVVDPGEQENGPLVGVARAQVRAIREVVVRVDPNKPESAIRGICVIDKVTKHDYDGHAALRLADFPAGISEGRLGKLRTIVREDLAKKFSDIVSLDAAYTFL